MKETVKELLDKGDAVLQTLNLSYGIGTVGVQTTSFQTRSGYKRVRGIAIVPPNPATATDNPFFFPENVAIGVQGLDGTIVDLTNWAFFRNENAASMLEKFAPVDAPADQNSIDVLTSFPVASLVALDYQVVLLLTKC